MSILVDKNTRVVTQGLGATGKFHLTGCRDYGTKMVAGVRPGKGGTDFEGVPIFDTVEDAVRKEGANVAVIYVPLCINFGFSPLATVALIGTAGALGDAGSPASDS